MPKQRSYTLIFWGFIFLLFNFYLQGLNVLPDVVGYILVGVGVNALREDNPKFGVVYYLCFALGILSIPNVYHTPGAAGLSTGAVSGNPILMLMGLLVWFGMFLFVYYLCRATAELANERLDPELARQSNVRWNMFLVLQLATGFIMLLHFAGAGSVTTMLVIVLLMYAIVVLIAFLTWLWRCRETL